MSLWVLFKLFYCRQLPCLVIICGHGQKWIFSFCLSLLIPPWKKWTLNHTLPLQMVEWKFSSLFFFFCHCLSECGVPTHTSGSISSAPLWAVLTPKMGEEIEGQLSPPCRAMFHQVAAMCVWKFSSWLPSKPSWHQEGEKQSVHLPCLMPYHSVSLLMSRETQLCAGLPTVLCWHGGRGRDSGGDGGNVYPTSSILLCFILPYGCWAGVEAYLLTEPHWFSN